jgi:Flp pilus assembly protein TadD
MALRGFLLVEELEATPAQRSEALVGRGVARLRLDETAEAVELFEAAAALQEDNPEALLGAALTLARLGRVEEAASHLRRALDTAEAQGREDLVEFARGEESLAGREADRRLREILSSH